MESRAAAEIPRVTFGTLVLAFGSACNKYRNSHDKDIERRHVLEKRAENHPDANSFGDKFSIHKKNVGHAENEILNNPIFCAHSNIQIDTGIEILRSRKL